MIPPHTQTFQIYQPDIFVKRIMPIYFPQLDSMDKFSDLLDQWGFETLLVEQASSGTDRQRSDSSLHQYRHPSGYFVRGQPALCHCMTLQTTCTTSRPNQGTDTTTTSSSNSISGSSGSSSTIRDRIPLPATVLSNPTTPADGDADQPEEEETTRSQQQQQQQQKSLLQKRRHSKQVGFCQ